MNTRSLPATRHCAAFAAFLILLSAFFINRATAQEDARHLMVYQEAGRFAAWPANEGMWAWGDEILVSFTTGGFRENERSHDIAPNTPETPQKLLFARSLDGGETWKTEYHPNFEMDRGKGASRIRTRVMTSTTPSPGGFDFSNPDFIMKFKWSAFYVSKNRGRAWEGPYAIPTFEKTPYTNYKGQARTNYIVTGKDSCMIFLTTLVTRGKDTCARPFVIETTDGGKTFQFVSWIGEDFFELAKDGWAYKVAKSNSIMPTALRLAGGRYICAVRQNAIHQNAPGRDYWTGIYESTDNCRAWKHISELEKNSDNPASLVLLKDGRIAAFYGNRRRNDASGPLGIAVKISSNNGATWSREIMLRQDARKWDLGYPRATLRPDGKVLVVYYYTTAKTPGNHIAATIWDPSAK